ncbi:MAG: hypothetical protein Fur0022_34710 [Anaerolineales bacterium]
MKKPKILLIGPTPPPYHGVAVSTQLILSSPALQAFQIIHLDTADRRSIENIGEFELGNILIGLYHALQFWFILLRHRPRLIYLPISQGTGGYLRDLAFLIPARWFNLRTVAHLRGSEFDQFYRTSHPLMQTLIRYSLAKVRRVIVLGENLRSLFDGLVPPERIAVIPNGTEDFTTTQQKPSETPSSTIRGIFLANLKPRKGFFTTFDAVLKALQHYPELKFSFVGDWGSQEIRTQTLSKLQNQNTNNRRLEFLGVVTGDQKNRLLMESDFFVFPPIEPEGHPRVILEAMAAGLPMITTPQGAIVETVLDNQTGFLVEPGQVDAIYEKIAYWIEHPDVMRKMGQAARERFLQHYTAERSNQRLAALFIQVLEE